MREIPLTKDKVALVDDDMYEFLAQWKWHVSKGGYAARTIHDGSKSRKPLYLHLLVLSPPVGMRCDHINRNRLDNQRVNLRLCTHQQNCHNRSPHQNGRSQYKGVHPDRSKWRASLTINYKKIHIGSFATEIEAAQAYDVKAKELFGSFAYMNFPDTAKSQHDIGVSAGATITLLEAGQS